LTSSKAFTPGKLLLSPRTWSSQLFWLPVSDTLLPEVGELRAIKRVAEGLFRAVNKKPAARAAGQNGI
jgi:hypothetical protein